MSSDESPLVQRVEASGTAVSESFLSAFRHHPSGVAIITADPGDGPVALTASSLISVGVAPPTIAFSLSDASSSARSIRRAETVVVHFVRRPDMQLARLCATSGADRFGPGVRWSRLPTGEPFYPEIDCWFRAIVRGRLAAPGAWLTTAELLSASPRANRVDRDETLVYADRAGTGSSPSPTRRRWCCGRTIRQRSDREVSISLARQAA